MPVPTATLVKLGYMRSIPYFEEDTGARLSNRVQIKFDFLDNDITDEKTDPDDDPNNEEVPPSESRNNAPPLSLTFAARATRPDQSLVSDGRSPLYSIG